MEIHGKGSVDPFLLGKVGKAFSQAGITKARRDKAVKSAETGLKQAGKAFRFTKSQALRKSSFFGNQVGKAILGAKGAERGSADLKDRLGEAGLW